MSDDLLSWFMVGSTIVAWSGIVIVLAWFFWFRKPPVSAPEPVSAQVTLTPALQRFLNARKKLKRWVPTRIWVVLLGGLLLVVLWRTGLVRRLVFVAFSPRVLEVAVIGVVGYFLTRPMLVKFKAWERLKAIFQAAQLQLSPVGSISVNLEVAGLHSQHPLIDAFNRVVDDFNRVASLLERIENRELRLALDETATLALMYVVIVIEDAHMNGKIAKSQDLCPRDEIHAAFLAIRDLPRIIEHALQIDWFPTEAQSFALDVAQTTHGVILTAMNQHAESVSRGAEKELELLRKFVTKH